MSDHPRNPAQIAPAHAAELLSKEGNCVITPGMLEEDIKAGAPVNADGTMNLVFYAAWLLKEDS